MIKLFGYEISFHREATNWADEDIWQQQEFILRIERLTPYEIEHRKGLDEIRREEIINKLKGGV